MAALDAPRAWVSGVTDLDFTVFNAVTFTYRTTDGDKNYTIQVRDLPVLPIN